MWPDRAKGGENVSSKKSFELMKNSHTVKKNSLTIRNLFCSKTWQYEKFWLFSSISLHKYFYYIDKSVLLESTPLVKFRTKLHPGLEWRIFYILASDIDDFTDIKFVS